MQVADAHGDANFERQGQPRMVAFKFIGQWHIRARSGLPNNSPRHAAGSRRPVTLFAIGIALMATSLLTLINDRASWPQR